MIQKVENALLRAYLRVRMEMLRLENEEDGMQTVEAVVLIAIAVVLAAAVLNLLTGDTKTGKGGIIEEIFKAIVEKIKKLLQ